MSHRQFLLKSLCIIGLFSIAMVFGNSFAQNAGKKFVILTASYNNIKFYKWNLDSVFNQTYQNWELIYIDDISTDGTGAAVQSYIKEKGFEAKVRFVANTEKCYCLKNYYREMLNVADDKIIVTLDGDDALIDTHVLQFLDRVYSNNPDIWCTYGNFSYFPKQERTKKMFQISAFPKEVIEKNEFRKHHWNIHHLRTFYAGLFKNIKLEDLFYEGQFFKVVEDVAFMLPIIEQCGKHHLFIDKPLYLYNVGNPLITPNVWKEEERKKMIQFVHSKTKYAPLQAAPYLEKPPSNHITDVILFNSNGWQRLREFLLCEIGQVLNEIGTIYVISNENTKLLGYQTISREFKNVRYLQANEPASTLFDLIEREMAPHILFCSDLASVNMQFSLNESIEKLNRTGAHTFYLFAEKAVLTDTTHLMNLGSGVSAFQLKYYMSLLTQTEFMNLYRKEDIIHAFSDTFGRTIIDLKSRPFDYHRDLNSVELILLS